MGDIGRIERAFSVIGTVWAVTGMVFVLVMVGHFSLGAVASVRDMFASPQTDPR